LGELIQREMKKKSIEDKLNHDEGAVDVEDPKEEG
jgi:hypothetical protein